MDKQVEDCLLYIIRKQVRNQGAETVFWWDRRDYEMLQLRELVALKLISVTKYFNHGGGGECSLIALSEEVQPLAVALLLRGQ